MQPLGRDSTQLPITAFEGRRRGHMPRNADGVWKLERTRKLSPGEAAGRTASRLDLSPASPRQGSDLHSWKTACVGKALTLWQIVTAAEENEYTRERRSRMRKSRRLKETDEA